MQSRLMHEAHGQRTYCLILDAGDEVMSQLARFAQQNGLRGSQISAIGAFEEVTLGYFDWEKKDYRRIPVRDQVEVVALLGDIAVGENGEPKVHAHAVLGKADGSALGGHLLEGRVRPTLEVILTELPKHLQRKHDPASGLALIELR